MGCDIHLYVEKKVNGKWICISPLEYLPYGEYEKRKLADLYNERNYELFGWLAQVRTINLNGFEPRGFPEDASDEVRRLYKSWGVDAHTPSYLTLKELKEKFKGNVKIRGIMEKERWKKLKESIDKGNPNWDLLYPYWQSPCRDGDTRFSVEIPMEYEFGSFKRAVLDFMKRYLFNSREEDIRIVFWFDN